MFEIFKNVWSSAVSYVRGNCCSTDEKEFEKFTSKRMFLEDFADTVYEESLVNFDDEKLVEYKEDCKAKRVMYPSVDSELSKFLMDMIRSGELYNNPKRVFKFIAKNTNPEWLKQGLWNIFNMPYDCYQEPSFFPLYNFSKNFVHCARAVDQTLQQVFEFSVNSRSEIELFQVDQGGADDFNSIFGRNSVQSLNGVECGDQITDYFARLKKNIKPGRRACLSISVASSSGGFFHAMNIVNMGPGDGGGEDRVFVICGQSGRVFDLLNDEDVSDFYEIYACNESSLKYALAPSNSDQLYADLQGLRIQKNLIKKQLTPFSV